MQKEEAFLAAILDEPGADDLRLVFADWLDDRNGPGDSEWAEFIRLSVAEPERTFWPTRGTESENDRAAVLCRTYWQEWTSRLRRQVRGTPLEPWLGTGSCFWAYRRGFVSVFEGTQQVVLDAWTDLYKLGPIEEVGLNNLWNLGAIVSLQVCLDKPCLRVLRLRAAELRLDCVDHLERASPWLQRLDRVELEARTPHAGAEEQLFDWLNSDSDFDHITWRRVE